MERVTKIKNKNFLMISILSISLLTVMAGAAVAPALNVIREYFKDSNQALVQMIISVPAIFIVITNGFFSRLCRKFGAKTLVVAGLLLYTIGGCAAGLFDNMAMILVMRALVGVGVGIIMPLSTGLLSFYFPPEMQDRLMGYSSAMNQMGGVIATLLSGVLAQISWRLSFMVYILGLISIVLCVLFLPNDRINQNEDTKEGNKVSLDIKNQDGNIIKVFKENYIYIVSMFLLMTVFFIYPANFAIETVKSGNAASEYIAVIMAGADFVAFFGGLLFVYMKKLFGAKTRFLAPAVFLAGYIFLIFSNSAAGIIAGSMFIGFANGAGIPFIIFEASVKAGRAAATTVMPLISAALYLAQFLCPLMISAVLGIFGSDISHLPYCFAAVLAALLCIWSVRMKVSAATV